MLICLLLECFSVCCHAFVVKHLLHVNFRNPSTPSSFQVKFYWPWTLFSDITLICLKDSKMKSNFDKKYIISLLSKLWSLDLKVCNQMNEKPAADCLALTSSSRSELVIVLWMFSTSKFPQKDEVFLVLQPKVTNCNYS